MFSNLRLVHFHCSLSLYFDAKATRAFVAGLFVLLFVCSPTTECVTIIPTNDLGHESKSQFNPSFCSHRPFLLRANPTWLIKTDPAFYLGLPSTSILQQSLWWWWWWWWYSFVFCGFWSNRTLYYFPLSSSVRPPFVRHRRDILTFLDILTVYTMKTIYFLNAYHPGW